jgi:hypothetical protein
MLDQTMKMILVILIVLIVTGCWTRGDEVVWKIQDSIQEIDKISAAPGPIARSKFNNAISKVNDINLDGKEFSTEDKAIIGKWLYKWKLACDEIGGRIQDDVR